MHGILFLWLYCDISVHLFQLCLSFLLACTVHYLTLKTARLQTCWQVRAPSWLLSSFIHSARLCSLPSFHHTSTIGWEGWGEKLLERHSVGKPGGWVAGSGPIPLSQSSAVVIPCTHPPSLIPTGELPPTIHSFCNSKAHILFFNWICNMEGHRSRGLGAAKCVNGMAGIWRNGQSS